MEEHGKGLVGYVANGNANLKTYGINIAYKGNTLRIVSTKYTTAYPFDSSTDNTNIENNNTNLNIASNNNYQKNTLIYGDGIRETSMTGTGSTSWYGDYSYYPSLYGSFLFRGGLLSNGSGSGMFYFGRTNGESNYNSGFRVALTVY